MHKDPTGLIPEAILRELEEFKEIEKSFDWLIDEARKLKDEVQASGRRIEAIHRQMEIDRAISDFERAHLQNRYERTRRMLRTTAPMRDSSGKVVRFRR